MKAKPKRDVDAMRVKQDFLALLDRNQSEQAYQGYIEAHTRLVPREFIQNHGIHFDLVLRKLAFGADYKSDFTYLSKSPDDWNCILIEIERPGAKFFRSGTNEFHPDFVKALQQINTWRAWFASEINKSSFANTTVGLIRTPLTENPMHPKFVLVHGRRAEYADNKLRRSLIAAQESADFKILTFDSLVEDLRSKGDLYLGVRRNEFIDIISDKFVGENIFRWMPSEQLRIGTKLCDDALSKRDEWFMNSPMAKLLNQVRMRPRPKTGAPSS